MANAEALVYDFRVWLEVHKTEILALQIFYNQPYRRRELTYSMVKDVLDILKSDKPNMAPITDNCIIYHQFKETAELDSRMIEQD
ncbi:type I restriction-modification enzyme R subunit C-terminal domain-containing protein [Leptospira santarosai]|nr:type I restriction-modification enzyme R subunit C-terminal domain-containing protein [Leptospira santarosai]MDI7212361.1 type I restriction-modification enzyme R subunit C-terminal domain-containing protein [Leptospira santarosai]MDI7226988.1 type I restriction-modification enzyme R subunit C-terminal domain-containing protein [Leptospira santarosai]